MRNKPKNYKKGFKKGLILIPILVIAGLVLSASNDSFYFKVNKSFDIFGSIFRELSSNYVLGLEPDELINAGIEGMLAKLDPYTVYYDESETSDLDVITHGNYTGLGITVGYRDSMITVIGIHDGYSAHRSGLRVGDRIYKIDSTIVLNLPTSKLRQYTRGKPGAKANLLVIREGLKDTLHIGLVREQIHLNNVAYSGFLNDSIGYIKLERFSRQSANEVKSAISDLRNSGKLSALVLDLRYNPGGLLESAVEISEIFLKKGSMIVSTKGRNSRTMYEYRSRVEPIEKDLPLAVLINDYSASASEIVAGALQDHDRAIVLGKTSFGKGLVQSLFDLPYRSKLKMTTARYYTPSGRCIQKVDFEKNITSTSLRPDIDTAIFYTDNGRKVIEYNGITPDSIIKEPDYPELIKDFGKENMLFNFATAYSAKIDSLPEDFTYSNKLIDQFKQYLKDKNYHFNSISNKILNEVKEIAKNDDYSPKTKRKITELDSLIRLEYDTNVDKYSESIGKILEKEIVKRFYPEGQLIRRNLADDKVIESTLKLFSPEKYNKILAIHPGLENNDDN